MLLVFSNNLETSVEIPRQLAGGGQDVSKICVHTELEGGAVSVLPDR